MLPSVDKRSALKGLFRTLHDCARLHDAPGLKRAIIPGPRARRQLAEGRRGLAGINRIFCTHRVDAALSTPKSLGSPLAQRGSRWVLRNARCTSFAERAAGQCGCALNSRR
jgi:hypothetical protein